MSAKPELQLNLTLVFSSAVLPMFEVVAERSDVYDLGDLFIQAVDQYAANEGLIAEGTLCDTKPHTKTQKSPLTGYERHGDSISIQVSFNSVDREIMEEILEDHKSLEALCRTAFDYYQESLGL